MNITELSRIGGQTVTPTVFFLFAAAASAAILGGALLFQFVGGLQPCPLCLYQRVPYVTVIALGTIGGLLAWRGLLSSTAATLIATLFALIFLTGGGIAGFHTGVEQGWWTGSTECVGAGGDAASTEELMQAILDAPAVRCDEIAWSLFGISLAGFNLLLSLALVAASAVVVSGWIRDARA